MTRPKFIQLSTDKGFTKKRFTDALICSDSIEAILAQFETFVAPEPKWGKQAQVQEAKRA